MNGGARTYRCWDWHPLRGTDAVSMAQICHAEIRVAAAIAMVMMSVAQRFPWESFGGPS
jgi:hypothetical protein